MKFKKNKFSKSPSSGQSGHSLNEYEDVGSEIDDSDGILDNLSEESDESSEEEVLALHSGSDVDSTEDEIDEDDENKISDSDLDQPDDDLPDSKAWGKKKRLFYNADHINDKKDYLNEEDELAAKMEEDEAKTTQKRWTSEIDNADLSLDLLLDDITKKKEERDVNDEKIVVNLSQMNQQEKMKLLKKESPKFLTFIEDYKRLLKCLENDLLPVMKHLLPGQLQRSSVGKFVTVYSQTIMNYCTNISFYAYLKSQRADSETHPIHEWISRYHKMLQEMEPIYDARIKPQIDLISGSFDFGKTSRRRKKKKSTSVDQNNIKMESDQENLSDSSLKKDGDLKSVDEEMITKSDDENDDSKRPITYQIAKNKGLTPRRKKELRNPRVKHRMKYRKAKIRRKGQIREVRKEIQKYSGEISGIKTNVVKSIKLKY